MKKKLYTIVLMLLLTLLILPAGAIASNDLDAHGLTIAAASSNSQIVWNTAYLQTLKGGFIDTIIQYAGDEDLSIFTFAAKCEKSALSMTPAELSKLNRIRARQLKPTADTLMQKVITTDRMNEYLSGKQVAFQGFISICADVKQYRKIPDFYYGLRLDYENTTFKPDAESCAVIRFKAANIEKAIIPRLKENGGTFSDKYPFGGVGFTTGTNERLGSPEWVMPEVIVLDDGAQLFQLFQDGREELKGIYQAEAKRFIPVVK